MPCWSDCRSGIRPWRCGTDRRRGFGIRSKVTLGSVISPSGPHRARAGSAHGRRSSFARSGRRRRSARMRNRTKVSFALATAPGDVLPVIRFLAVLGPLVFLFTAITVQVLHPGYDWVRAPLSFYLSGPHGPWLQGAYVFLAAAISAQAWLSWRAERAGALNSIALLLFLGGAIALILTALYPGGSPAGRVSPFEHRLHTTSALLAFGLTGLGLLLRGGLDWWRGERVFLPLAVLAVAMLLAHVFVRELPRGASQKLTIALYLLWLGLHGWRTPDRRWNRH